MPDRLAAVGPSQGVVVGDASPRPVSAIVQRLSTAMQAHLSAPLETVLIRLRSAGASLLFRQQGQPERSKPASVGGAHGLTILLMTDLEDFTSTLERLGDARGQELIHTHNALLRACLKRHRGREVTHTGDGLLAAFGSALSALRCAIAMQRCLHEHNLQHAQTPLKVRIGLHAGKPLPEEDRLFGSCVNIAARVCARASAQRILVSEAVFALVDPSELELIDRGGHLLKGVAAPIRLRELRWRRPPAHARAATARDHTLN